jgi:hypothetical protein
MNVGPLLMWRYKMALAVEFLEAAGYELLAWGVTIPITKHGGLVITWMRKEKPK